MRKLLNGSLLRYIALSLMIGTLVLALGGCARKQPIRIGYTGMLTGIASGFGVQARNGAQLAVDKINASGGIDGRPVELISRDDHFTRQGTHAADRSLIKAGVVAIIGHGYSEAATYALPDINAARIVMIDPTTASSKLVGKSKYLFLVSSTSGAGVRSLAQYIYRHGITRVGVFLDTNNAALYRDILMRFADQYRSLGGTIVDTITFSTKSAPFFDPILAKMRAAKAGGLLLFTTYFDAGIIAQRTRLRGWNVPLFATRVAQNEGLLRIGGRAIEGMVFELSYNMNSSSPALAHFKALYEARYGNQPDFHAALSYEAADVLLAALKKTGGSARGLRQALLETRNFKGLVDTFSFNKNGDAMRPSYLGAVRGGRFVTIAVVKPPGSRM